MNNPREADLPPAYWPVYHHRRRLTCSPLSSYRLNCDVSHHSKNRQFLRTDSGRVAGSDGIRAIARGRQLRRLCDDRRRPCAAWHPGRTRVPAGRRRKTATRRFGAVPLSRRRLLRRIEIADRSRFGVQADAGALGDNRRRAGPLVVAGTSYGCRTAYRPRERSRPGHSASATMTSRANVTAGR
jgi:hypothetical protein